MFSKYRIVVKEEVHNEVQSEIKPLKSMVGGLQKDMKQLKKGQEKFRKILTL